MTDVEKAEIERVTGHPVLDFDGLDLGLTWDGPHYVAIRFARNGLPTRQFALLSSEDAIRLGDAIRERIGSTFRFPG